MFGDIINLGWKIGFEPGIKEKERLANAKAAREAERREAERNSLTTRMKEAKKAGLHPLVALGAHQPTSSQWVQTQGSGLDLGESLRNIGNKIQTGDEREMDKLAIRSAQLDVQGKELDNAYKASQIRRMGTNPTIPDWNDAGSVMSGQGDASIKMRPAEIIASQSGTPAGEAGAVTDFGYAKTGQGGLALVPSSDVKNKIEDQFIPEAAWAARNTYLFSEPPYPGKEYNRLLPKGFDHWLWIPSIQEWRPANKNTVLGFRKGGRMGPFVDVPKNHYKSVPRTKYGPKY